MAVAVAGVAVLALSLWAWVSVVQSHRGELWSLLDLDVYRQAARAAADHGGDIYAMRFGPAQLPFIYPPIAAVLFGAFDVLSVPDQRTTATAASLAAMAACVWAAWGMVGWRRDFGRLGATTAVVAVALWLEPVQQTLSFGQVNLWLMALVVLDAARPDHRRTKGALTGIAAGLKLTPALFAVYWLLTGRRRAAGTAAAAFAATVALGWARLPAASNAYWLDGAWNVGDKVTQDYIGNQSLRGAIGRLLADSAAVTALWLLVAFVAAGAGLWAATRYGRRGRELDAVLLVALTTLLVSPISWTHHWVWAAPAMVAGAHWALGRSRSSRCRRSVRIGVAVALAGVVGLLLAWPARLDGQGRFDPAAPALPTGLLWRLPHRDGLEYRWTVLEAVAGNGYVLAGTAMLALAAAGARRRAAPTAPQ
ncbi:MAG: glycosyltransferase 87 family protein [Acidimicrobiia bacterium]